jgi:peptide/nickel transport system substrate-binding protein
LLEEVGWKDEDNNPATPRVARGVVNVPDGSLLEINYMTTKAGQRQQTSALLAQSLAQCGIKANLKYMTNDELFAEGPGGPFFGRQFDLVQYTWDNLSTWRKPPCALYQGTQVPNQTNRWNGVNTSGYANPEYDLACQDAAENLLEQPGFNDNLVKTLRLYANDLPSIPLYQRLVMAATRPDLCGFKLDPTTASDLWNLERFDLAPNCSE